MKKVARMYLRCVVIERWILLYILLLVIYIQGGPKVGIQYIVNYCKPNVYLLLAHAACRQHRRCIIPQAVNTV